MPGATAVLWQKMQFMFHVAWCADQSSLSRSRKRH
jgi:hypothetical protein